MSALTRSLIAIITSAVGSLSTASELGSHSSKAKLSTVQQQHAEQWQVTQQEYRRYLEILQSPRAYFTPNLDKNPLLALALEAETDEERRSLADRWVQIELDNNIKVVRWQLEVTNAWKRQFPDVPRFVYKNPELSQYRISTMSETSTTDEKRAQLFVRASYCDACVAAFERELNALNRGKLGGIDVHFVDKPSKVTITEWAVARNISPEDVNNTRRVTLNWASSNANAIPHVTYQ